MSQRVLENATGLGDLAGKVCLVCDGKQKAMGTSSLPVSWFDYNIFLQYFPKIISNGPVHTG